MTLDIAISADDRSKITEALNLLLADTYTLYLKTHNFHWNVTGPMFQTLHLMFEEQYNELWLATDEIAERIRALGAFAPGSYGAYSKLTTISDTDGVPQATEMIRQLLVGHEAVIKTARKAFPAVEAASDEVSTDLLVQRLAVHEKTAWMLRSLLGQ